MARPRIHALVFAALAFAACKKADTILLIEVYGPADIHPSQLNVTITAGLETKAIPVPATLGELGLITLPASFTVALDRSHAGPVTVSVDAFDELGSPIAFGTTMQDHIAIGGQTIIAVSLSPSLEPTNPDGGADGAAGAGGPGGGGQGGAGQSGAAGTAAAGQDGAADAVDTGAPDAPGDRADGMGLDRATD